MTELTNKQIARQAKSMQLRDAVTLSYSFHEMHQCWGCGYPFDRDDTVVISNHPEVTNDAVFCSKKCLLDTLSRERSEL